MGKCIDFKGYSRLTLDRIGLGKWSVQSPMPIEKF